MRPAAGTVAEGVSAFLGLEGFGFTEGFWVKTVVEQAIPGINKLKYPAREIGSESPAYGQRGSDRGLRRKWGCGAIHTGPATLDHQDVVVRSADRGPAWVARPGSSDHRAPTSDPSQRLPRIYSTLTLQLRTRLPYWPDPTGRTPRAHLVATPRYVLREQLWAWCHVKHRPQVARSA